jgi:hypothetical protein
VGLLLPNLRQVYSFSGKFQEVHKTEQNCMNRKQ